MKEYKKPVVNKVSIQINGILRSSGIVYNQKTYNCPIKPCVRCDEYNAVMQNWKRTVKYVAEHNVNRTFITGDDRLSCPNKNCAIFVQWQRQNKTK